MAHRGVICAALVVFGGASLVSVEAEAQAPSGTQAASAIAVTLGTIGGLTTSIATLVYALNETTFDSPWIGASLFSAAVCSSMAVFIVADGAQNEFTTGSAIGVLLYLTLATIPTYWTIRTALAEVNPGERFDAIEIEQEELRKQQRGAIDPWDGIDDRDDKTLPTAAFSVSF